MNDQERRLITLLPRDIKLFLSSTFENLHNERQILKNEVFSVLAAKYRKLGINLTVTDLRWGITNELDQTEDTVSICLKEVERAQPYFVGLLGGRYGWVPERKHINENTAFYEQYKDLLDDYLSQKISMTEMEIRFGVLERDKVERIRGKSFNKRLVTRFYFGDEAVYNDYEDSRAREKQATLKNEIKRLGYYAGDFENVETLKALVAKDLEEQIERDILEDLRHEGYDFKSFEAIQLSDEQQHYLEYYAFEKYNTQHYIKRLADEQVESLLKQHNKKNKPILVHGESGTGKSAILSYLAQQLSLNGSERLFNLIRCYIGATQNVTTAETLVRYVAKEINRINGTEEPIEINKDNMVKFIESWAYNLKEPTLLIIDGVNQLVTEKYENGLMYLPLVLPEKVRILISSTTEYLEAKRIDLARYDVVEVHAFIAAEKERYIQTFLLNHAKKIDFVINDFLVNKTDDFQSNPLYLNLVLKEVALSGLQTARLERGFDDKAILRQEEEREIRKQLERADIDAPSKVQYIVQLLKYYSDSSDFNDLFMRLISYYEFIFNAEIVRKICCFILYSRDGLYDEEIKELIKEYKALDVLPVLSMLEHHMIKRLGQSSFYHSYVIEAIRSKYDTYEIEMREELCAFFEVQYIKEKSENNLSEYVYQLIALEKWDEFHDLIKDVESYEKMCINHFVELRDGVSKIYGSSARVDEILRPIYEEVRGPNALIVSSEILNFYDVLDANNTLLLRILDQKLLEYGEEHQIIWNVRHLLAGVLASKGQYEKAFELYDQVATRTLKAYGEDNPNLWSVWHNAAGVLHSMGKHEHAAELYEKVAEKRLANYGEDFPDLWITWSNLAVVLITKGQFDQAIELLEKVATKQLAAYGEDFVDLWITQRKIAVIFDITGQYDKAADLCEQIAEKQMAAYGEEFVDLYITRRTMAVVAISKGQFDQAIELLEKVAAKQLDAYGEDNPELWRTWSDLAEALTSKGQFDQAIELLEKVAIKQLEVYGEDNPDLWRTWSDLAKVLTSKGQFDQAIELIEKVSAKQLANYGEDFPDLWITWSNLAMVLYSKGQYDCALELLEEVGAKFLEAYGEDFSFTQKLCGNLAVVLGSKGQYDKAIELCENLVSKYLENYGENFPGLWVTWSNLAGFLHSKGQYDRAVELYEKVSAKQLANYGEDFPDLWKTWCKLAGSYVFKGERESAVELYEKVSAKQLANYGEDFPDLWTTWSNLAMVLNSMGQYDRAVELYEKVAVKEFTAYGEDFPDLWTTWSNLAMVLNSMGQYDRVVELYEKIAIKRLKAYGCDDQNLWTTWSNLAGTLEAKGEHDQAIELYKLVADKMLSAYGEDNRGLWIIWNNLAYSLKNKGQYDRAIDLYEQIAVKRLVAYGEDCPNLWTTWDNLADVLRLKGQYDKAIELYEKVAAKRLAVYGEYYPDLWTTWHNLAYSLDLKGQYDRSIELYKQVAAKQLVAYGEDNPSLWFTWYCLADALELNSQYDKAIEIYKQVAAKELSAYGDDYSDLWITWHYLSISHYRFAKQLNEIEQYSSELDHRLKSIDIYKKLIQKDPQKYSENYKTLYDELLNLVKVQFDENLADQIQAEYSFTLDS